MVCEPAPSILEELSYYPSPNTNVYKAKGALTFEECEQTKEDNNTLWLGPDHSPDVGFVIDLGFEGVATLHERDCHMGIIRGGSLGLSLGPHLSH